MTAPMPMELGVPWFVVQSAPLVVFLVILVGLMVRDVWVRLVVKGGG